MLTGKPIGKRALGGPSRRQEGNINIDIQGIGVHMRKWIDSTQGSDYWRAVVNVLLNLKVL